MGKTNHEMEIISTRKLVWDHLCQCCSPLKWMETQTFGEEMDLKGDLFQVTLWQQSLLSEISLMYYRG